MIKLVKGATPAILVQKAADWTKALLEKRARGETLTAGDKTRYAHKEIKVALVAETNGKCAYCESKLRHITHGDIEHIVPKSIRPERWFDWQNLTLACDVCNGNKSNFDSNHDTFIDPYTADPEEHFWVHGGLILPTPGNEAAQITERVLALNRAELVERRQERLLSLMKHLHIIKHTQDDQLKSILQSDFLEESKPDKEFAALAREITRRAGISDKDPAILSSDQVTATAA
jgi:uncharacterized protein (TIGR02646 family)